MNYLRPHCKPPPSLQLLVRLNMKVECMVLDGEGKASVSQQDMFHYVVFEKDRNDFLSTYRIVNKVRNSYRGRGRVVRVKVASRLFIHA